MKQLLSTLLAYPKRWLVVWDFSVKARCCKCRYLLQRRGAPSIDQAATGLPAREQRYGHGRPMPEAILAAADRLFFGWAVLLGAMTVCSLLARPPGNTGLLLISFVVALVAYCVTPMTLPRQLFLALSYSAAALFVACRTDGATIGAVAVSYALANLFGAITSWRANHRRRDDKRSHLRTS